MSKINFPPVENADETGLLAFGGALDTDILTTAYSQGIFPWPLGAEYPMAWFSPNPRGVLFAKNLHLSSSFKKWLKKTSFTVFFNRDFEKIILSCAKSINRKEGSETWISDEIISAYSDLFKQDKAYCIGVYDNGELVGGLYGVNINNYYSGESMFYLKPNASKLALYHLVLHLNKNGIPWVDTQMVTPILKSFGAIEIPRSHFIYILKQQI